MPELHPITLIRDEIADMPADELVNLFDSFRTYRGEEIPFSRQLHLFSEYFGERYLVDTDCEAYVCEATILRIDTILIENTLLSIYPILGDLLRIRYLCSNRKEFCVSSRRNGRYVGQ